MSLGLRGEGPSRQAGRGWSSRKATEGVDMISCPVSHIFGNLGTAGASDGKSCPGNCQAAWLGGGAVTGSGLPNDVQSPLHLFPPPWTTDTGSG